ncbi:redoxin domain-containing protein [Streptomyces sp. SID8375]|uniref:TlpA family protein disulfide reductase n=1 Tax=Streptomyces nigrescens TaxID=1920 RepID=A0ABY7J4T8_STRNI|nr:MULTISPECIES: TlpA disulfide reductase family protein [Streptomyces]MCW7987997.1 redoxin domain-containing protein [Streptomyces platensis subsp. clarensis]MCR8576517.1 TlpA family protein disulfide reductase [Streptomyces sp. Isolate_219]MYX06478.1 redoxin domain-containing protein [Streptomyces sp. SID8375]QIK08011.1 TlpA family protein disulfide reductase [Streptomyces sp. ID38640]UYB41616.1 TlpA family protein disulfide reductase [Streptomyces sp. Je 1-4]
MSACRAPRRLTSRRRVALLAAGAAAAALTLSACGDGASGGSAQTRFVQGKNGVDTVKKGERQPAPELSGESTTGKKLDVADYKGKVVILNVWGSWCGPCIAEAPNFSKVANETKDKGVQFLGINTRDSEKSQATSFEEEHKVPYPSLFDPTGRLMLRFPKGSLNPQSIPSTIAIDRQGKIAARSIGPLAEDDLRKMVEPLIAEK